MEPGQEQDGGNGGEPQSKTFTEAEVNKLVEDRLARDRKKAQDEKAQLVKQLETLKTSGLGAEEKKAFEEQLEALRNQTLTQEELAAKARTKLEKDYQAKLEAATVAAETWQSQYTDARIGHEIQAQAAAHEVLPAGMKFAEALLRPLVRLVPHVDADGRPIPGAYETKVKFPSKDSDGKPVVLDISVSEAFKQMKETPEEYGALFKAHTQGGIGAGNYGSPDKPADIAKLIRDNPEAYLAKFHPKQGS